MSFLLRAALPYTCKAGNNNCVSTKEAAKHVAVLLHQRTKKRNRNLHPTYLLISIFCISASPSISTTIYHRNAHTTEENMILFDISVFYCFASMDLFLLCVKIVSAPFFHLLLNVITFEKNIKSKVLLSFPLRREQTAILVRGAVSEMVLTFQNAKTPIVGHIENFLWLRYHFQRRKKKK